MVKTIGILGGGQLGRMLTQAALPLGFDVIVVDPGENCPAAQVGAEQIVAPFTDEVAIEELAEKCDVITIEIEHVNTAPLHKLQKIGADIHPAPQTIDLIQDKLVQKQHLTAANVAVAPFIDAEDQSFEELSKKLGDRFHLKTRKGAYDGRGNAVIETEADFKHALDRFEDAQLYAEAHVPFKQELSVLLARSSAGDVVPFEVVETVHKNNICHMVFCPAHISPDVNKAAVDLATKAINTLEGSGVYAVEMFLAESGELMVNEIAPRVHNSGHHTIDAMHTSQFEQHIRAVTGLPLGDPTMTVPASTMINILGERNGEVELTGLDSIMKLPRTHVHVYGKSPTKEERKMGHITACGPDLASTTKIANLARKELSI